MDHCTACKRLEGAPADTAPHERLRYIMAMICYDGELENYHCLACGSVLIRFLPNDRYSGHARLWERFRREGE